MAQIVLSEAGAALGRRLLPQGLSWLGRTLTGAAIGRAAGSLVGGAIDGYFAAPAEGPRIKSLHVMGAAEGEGIATVFGRMRVGGQLIWASRFREHRTTERTGVKGGARTVQSRYTVSFAVALGAGPIQRVARAWANGEPFDLSGVDYRFYSGTEDQLPDPLIEMIEGAAPAYCGIGYIVFEDLALEAFGNRMPQMSFEVVRAPEDPDSGSLASVVTAVNLIPASGEFVYAPTIVREVLRPGAERALNANSGAARADFLVSLDQLRDDLPRVSHVALTCGWFASGIAAGDCTIRPGAETSARETVPLNWSVAGETRAEAYLVSRDDDGRPNYGGTPSDVTVVEAIRELKDRGYLVTLTPFLFVDAPGFAWRGRITVSADGTAGARSEIEAFVNGGQGYRRFILHHAQLAAEAGGVEALLIGSEMRGLTRVRDESGAFPFVEALRSLAAEVKAILPDALISYAADWTEYGAYVPGDGSGDVLFPLDDLWADENIGFIGIDWYPPMGDWRDTEGHLDAMAGYASADDPDYLASQFAGGEAYKWYYADAAARDAQDRTPIVDTAHGEHWVFRAKDLAGWAAALHYPRPGGVRAASPTGWVPGSKSIRLSEIGFAAVDKAGNAPNLFVDPKSTESGLPPFSSGERDDVIQARLLGSVLPRLEAEGVVSAAHVWAWDARPFPAWPARDDIWGDGGNWARGHWLNGRSGLSALSHVVAEICAEGGVSPVDTRALDGVVEGYVLDGVSSVRAALEPLQAAFGFEAIERDATIVFRMSGDGAARIVSSAHLSEGGLVRARQLMDKAPERLRLTCIDPDKDYQPMVVDARRGEGDARLVADVTLPMALSRSRADVIVRYLLDTTARMQTAEVTGGPGLVALETGDRIETDDGEVWRIDAVTDEGIRRQFSLTEVLQSLPRARAIAASAVPNAAPVYPEPDLIVIDAPALSSLPGDGPVVAAYADPWPGEMAVLAGLSADDLTERVRLGQPAVIGRLLTAVGAGPVGRWEHHGRLHVRALAGSFSSLPVAAVLAGGNAALLETADGWELVQFTVAELTGPDEWQLSGLLRGQGGSRSARAEAGARLVLLDASVQRASVSEAEPGMDLLWRARGASSVQTLRFDRRSSLPWQPCHLRVRAGVASWTRRGPDVADSWTFAEAPNIGRFVAEFDTGSGFGGALELDAASCSVPAGTTAMRVAEVGPDGRRGGWLSIGPGSPYL